MNSIFGVSSVNDTLLPSTESLEVLISRLQSKGVFGEVVLGISNPYVVLKTDIGKRKLYLACSTKYFSDMGCALRSQELNGSN